MTKEYPKCSEGMAASWFWNLKVAMRSAMKRDVAKRQVVLVRRPGRRMLVRMDRINEPKLLEGQEARGHARPAREHNEREQVAGDERAAHAAKHRRRCVLKEVDHEADSRRDVHVGVDLVERVNPEGRAHDPVLHGELDADAEVALEVEDLNAVLPRNAGRLFLQRQSGDGTTNLVDLE